MNCETGCLTIAFFLYMVSPSIAQTNEVVKDSIYAATDSQAIAELTVEEMQFYRSDYFPLSLAERGRQSATAWRGMPPGFLDYRFQNMSLVHPLWGYWDNQLLPIEIIRRRDLQPSNLQYRLVPAAVTTRSQPVSRVAYSQDFQFGLSYLDINLTRFYRKNSYVRLGGNNFVRNGSLQPYTKIQVNTYRGQIHHQFSSNLSIDLWYWQLRHRFRISSFPILEQIKKVHRVGQLLWVNANFLPDSSNRLVFTPFAHQWEDNYRPGDESDQRKMKMFSLGSNIEYTSQLGWGRIKVSSQVIRHRITQSFHLENTGQWEGRLHFQLRKDWSAWWIKAGSGYHSYQEVGNSPELNFSVGWNGPFGWKQQFAAVNKPHNVPLAALYWNTQNITGVRNPRVPLRQSFNYRLEIPLFAGTRLALEPFFNRFYNAWSYDPAKSRFLQKDYDNPGVSLNCSTNILWFHFDNKTTYSHNYESVFAPRINNVLKGDLAFSLFDRALKLHGYAIYHFIGQWRRPDFHPLTNQYFRTGLEAGNYHILDFKVLAHIKTATLFFVWENALSQDYALVDDYREVFRVFRFGIYWTLFN